MGKSPLLPVYAASLGAGEVLLGMIVSVSTLSGLVLKPLVGTLSDRWGRRVWLLVGTAFFAGMPFVYRFVATPEQLFAVRVVHGMATAIYGPVTIAYVAELSRTRRAEALGWFSTARGAGYVVGPAAAGWMLLSIDPVSVFTVVGLLSAAAFLPIALLPEPGAARAAARAPIVRQALAALWIGGRTPAVWLAGGLDAGILVAVYAVKAFVPLLAISIGASVALAGVFLAVQEAVHMALNPLGGRLGDRVGYLNVARVGVAVLGVALVTLTFARNGVGLMAPAVLIGVAQALVSPASLALASSRIGSDHLGAGMGLVGSMKNAGKVVGPVLAGALIFWLDFSVAFRLMGLAMLIAAALLWSAGRVRARAPAATKRAAAD